MLKKSADLDSVRVCGTTKFDEYWTTVSGKWLNFTSKIINSLVVYSVAQTSWTNVLVKSFFFQQSTPIRILVSTWGKNKWEIGNSVVGTLTKLPPGQWETGNSVVGTLTKLPSGQWETGNSVVGTVTKLQPGQPKIRGSIPRRDKRLFPSRNLPDWHFTPEITTP